MIDLFRTIARFFSSDSNTEALMSGGLGPWEERPEEDSSRKRPSYAQKKPGPAHDATSSQQFTENNHTQRTRMAQSRSEADNGISQSHGRTDKQDRILMPPPAARSVAASSRHFAHMSDAAASHYTSEVDARTMVTRRSQNSVIQGISNDEFEKLAQEHAAKFWAQPKPGFWYKSEEGLYFHLWMRGRERIMSIAWAPDFKTYPQQLFSTDSEEAHLIDSINLPQYHEKRTPRQFRALRALRELVDLGSKVRDNQQSKLNTAKIQNTIHRGIKAYVGWALTDADLYDTASTTPTHCIVQRRAKQTIAEAISTIASTMSQHLEDLEECFPADTPQPNYPSLPELKRDSSGISPGPPLSPIESSDSDPKVRDDSQGNLPPVVIGFLIVGTSVTIFTLNGRNADAAHEINDPTRGIHMLIKFNFNESGDDVWNALAIALTACHLRNALLAVAKPNTDYPNARFTQADVAGYVGKEEQTDVEKKRKRKDYEREGDEDDEADFRDKGKSPAKQNDSKRLKGMVGDEEDPDR